MNIIEQMLKKYNPKSETEPINALKEIFQEITLLGLYRGGFFNKAAFLWRNEFENTLWVREIFRGFRLFTLRKKQKL